MAKNTNELIKKAAELFNQEKFDDVITLLTDELLKKLKNAELYVWRGNAWYNKKDDQSKNKAINDYDKAIDINKNYTLALYNKAQIFITRKDYSEAIKYLDKVINLDPKFAEAYISRGHINRVFYESYDKAIEDYTQAMIRSISDRNAYYYRGLTYYKKAINEENNIESIQRSKNDLEKYLDITSEENDIGVRYANYYLKKLDEINDTDLTEIKNLVFKIKESLCLNEDCITHYTSLSSMKILILADNSKLRISEGNFMNDPSEGTEFYSFLYDEYKKKEVETTEMEAFVPKPFIGSFVTKDKCNNLNMWRFYGKEDGVEAKGCAIVLRRKDYIEDIKDSLSNEKNEEARIEDESDINFYRVVYLPHNSSNFKIPKLESDKAGEFAGMMNTLKKCVNAYINKETANITSLEEYLNYIAFLFKRDDYENENEVRLVMNGIEFEKKFCEKNKDDKSVNPPRVYIELMPIRTSVEQITLGPKVDKANEWASALYYSYKKEKRMPKIAISHLPYK